MKHHSAYLDWYEHVEKAKYDFRSSGLSHFTCKLDLGDVDLSVNYTRGNPEAAGLLGQRARRSALLARSSKRHAKSAR